jgi:hypothetical protein
MARHTRSGGVAGRARKRAIPINPFGARDWMQSLDLPALSTTPECFRPSLRSRAPGAGAPGVRRALPRPSPASGARAEPISPWGARGQFLGFSGGVIAGRWCAVACCRPVGVLVVWSFVYLALRRILALMVLCWRSADAKQCDGTAAGCADAGPIRRCRAAGHRLPHRCRPGSCGWPASTRGGRPAHPRGAAAAWLPGLRKLHRQGPARQPPPASAASGRRIPDLAVVATPAGSGHPGLRPP